MTIRPHFVPEDATNCGLPRRRLEGELFWYYGTQPRVRTIYADPKSRHPHSVRSRRRVASLPQWLRFLPPTRGHRWAEDICNLMERIGIRSPLPMSPAQLAWRLYRMSIAPRMSTFIPLPVIIGCIRSTEDRHHGPYWITDPGVREEPEVWVYDINQAYAHQLARLPEIANGTGRWEWTPHYAGPWGIYHLQGGESEPGTAIENTPTPQTRVDGGWVWRTWQPLYANGGPTTSFSTFLSRLYLAGTMSPARMRPLIKRLPVLFVGKCYQHDLTSPLIWSSTGSCYPPIWSWVTGGVRSLMREIVERYGPIVHAFIDCVHLRRPLPPELVSDQDGEPGKWKLLAHGPARYLGLNCFVVGDLFRHQGIDGPEESARAQFEMMWGRGRSA